MKKIDLAVIGSGIGGSLISILNKDKQLVLFEKDKNLGGTASTFKRFGNYFNSGATTFVGYENNHIIKDNFRWLRIGIKSTLKILIKKED